MVVRTLPHGRVASRLLQRGMLLKTAMDKLSVIDAAVVRRIPPDVVAPSA